METATREMAGTQTCSLFQLTDSIKEPKVHAHVYRNLQLDLILSHFAYLKPIAYGLISSEVLTAITIHTPTYLVGCDPVPLAAWAWLTFRPRRRGQDVPPKRTHDVYLQDITPHSLYVFTVPYYPLFSMRYPSL